MYESNSYKLLIAFLMLIGYSHLQAVVEEDKAKWKHLDKKLLDNTTTTALERWHTDSLGCLNLRTGKDSDVLIATFGLDNSNSDSVTVVLGQPNFTTKGVENDKEGNEINVVRYIYFFHSECGDDSISPSSFIAFIISTDTKQVVKRVGGVY